MRKIIGKRLEEERERLGKKKGEMAALGGVVGSAYTNYLEGNRAPDADFLVSIASAGADIQYILTGRRMPKDVQINEPSKFYSASEYHEIPHYNIQAAAGSGAIPVNEEQLKPLAFRRDWLAKRHLSPASLVIVDVRGDSMEPKLQDGDLVLVDTSQTDIANGKTYVLRMDGHLLVKNLQRIPHGLVLVSSFNAGFSPYEADLCDESLDMAVIGRVVASMHEW